MLSRTRNLVGLLTVCLAALAALPSHAAVVSGTFAGVARDGLFLSNGVPVPTFDGANVTGTFRVDTGLLGPPTPESADFVSYVLAGSALQLSFTVLGQSYSFGNQGLHSAATLFNNGEGQSVTFAANVLGQTDCVALFSLGGNLPDGATGLYADGLDLSTFHAAPVDLAFAFAAFQLSFDVGAILELSEVRFDEVMPVPEPASAILLFTGLLLLACQRWHCRRRGLV